MTIGCCLLCLSYASGKPNLLLPSKEELRDMLLAAAELWPCLTSLGLQEQQVQLSRALPDSSQHLVSAPSFLSSAGAARPLILRAATLSFASAVEPALFA